MRCFLCLLLLSLSGCLPLAADIERHDYTAEAAVTAALSTMGEPRPDPPAGECENCNGTGVLGDGVVKLKCPVCGGDGRIDDGDRGESFPAAELQSSLEQIAYERDVQHHFSGSAASYRRLLELTSASMSDEHAAAVKAAAEPPPAAEETVIRNGLLMFVTDACVPCRKFQADVVPWLRESGGWSDENLQIVDKYHSQLDERFGVDTCPTFILLRSGEAVRRHTGGLDRDEFSTWYTGETAAAPMSYAPAGDVPWYQTELGRPTFAHLVEVHGFDPETLRNTPRADWDYLHGDAHRGLRSRRVRLVTVPTYCPSCQ